MFKKRHFSFDLLIATVGFGLFFGAASESHALTFHAEINTSSLINDSTGPFSIEFQFNDGLGVGDANNTVTIENFTFDGGSASGTPSLVGGAGGSLSTSVTLMDTSFFNDFVEGFVPGSTLGFDVSSTTNVDLGATPDIFYFTILDGNYIPIPTLGLGDAFLLVTIDSPIPPVETFGTDASRTTIAINPPTPQQPAPVPSPGSLSLLATGFLIGILARLAKPRVIDPGLGSRLSY